MMDHLSLFEANDNKLGENDINEAFHDEHVMGLFGGGGE